MSRVLDILRKEYFDWMYELICDDRRSKRRSYKKLLYHLHNIEFIYIVKMDDNRAKDGENLRYRFACDRPGCHSCNRDQIISALDDEPCSVLEMMIALALRCEEQIMEDLDIGNRTGKWFWDMVFNLGLGDMSDSRFDIQYVDEVIGRFLNREYEENGKGGLFTVERCGYNLREVEIWYQMLWYLDEIC